MSDGRGTHGDWREASGHARALLLPCLLLHERLDEERRGGESEQGKGGEIGDN